MPNESDLFDKAGIQSVRRRGNTAHIVFGSNDVRRHTKEVPCRVWRVVQMPDGLHHEERRRCVKPTTIERAVREAGRGWRPGATAQWVEVRPDDWRPRGKS